MSWCGFEDIEGWQVARELNRSVWRLVVDGRFRNDLSLMDQINRSAGSVMDNIAEGFEAGSNAEFIRFLRYAQRSAAETKSQLYRAQDREHITAEEFQALLALQREVYNKIGGLIKYLKNSSKPQ